MKNIKSLYFALLLILSLGVVSCSDFEDLNKSPYAAGAEQVEMEYFINNSIIGAQQNPDTAERAFVLYWKDAGRQDRTGTLSENYSDDGWTTNYFNDLTGWLSNVNTAIDIYNEKKAAGELESYSNNLYQVARIWRVYLMSEFADNFGAMPINGFQAQEVTFNSVEEVYDFLLAELKEAVNGFDAATVTEAVSKLDPAFGYDFSKWAKYGNSMRMRLAMRLSEAKPALAQAEFEDAVKGAYISELADNFAVQEKSGWDALSGVMSREWNMQYLSTTLNNLYIGLGGVTTEEFIGSYVKSAIAKRNEDMTKAYEESLKEAQKESDAKKRAEKIDQIKKGYILIKEEPFNEADWLGVRYDKHFATKTNDPMAGYWNDGLNYIMDPRAYKAFNIPGDINNPHFNKYPSWATGNVTNTIRPLLSVEVRKVMEDGKEVEKRDTVALINSAFMWNTSVAGNWGEKAAINNVRSFPGNTPRLVNEFRNNSMERVFFGSWESYFLIAEASVRGWNVPMSGKDAYERGIRENFGYWDSVFGDNKIQGLLSTYLASTSYNRVGTSVSWDHIAEPPATQTMRYLDGYTQKVETVEWKYPVNHLYKGGSVKNDQLTKIITQKFIAQVPWLPLETWSDHRRLGLPFFENPAVEKTIEGFEALTQSNYMESRWEFFPQRQPYPTSLKNNVPQSYQDAVTKLGGPDEVGTKMFWSGKK